MTGIDSSLVVRIRSRLAGTASYAAIQIIVQGIGFIAGVVLVRTVAVQDYADYVLAISMFGVASVLLDLGLANAVLSTGGRFIGDRVSMAELVGDAFRVYRQIVGAILPCLAVIFLGMFMYRHVSAWYAALLVTLALGCAAVQVRIGLVLAIMRLFGETRLQQSMDLVAGGAKALTIGVLALVGLSTPAALATNLASAYGTWKFSQRWLSTHVSVVTSASGAHGGRLRALVRKQAANSVYYCVSGQVALWLVGLHGSTRGMAEIGALGRLAAAFAIVSAMIATIAQPFFARNHDSRTLNLTFVLMNLGFATVTVLLWAYSGFYPDTILWVLGRSYSKLQMVVPWMVLATCLSAWGSAIYSLGSARGWVVPSTWMIGTGVVSMTASIRWIDVSTPTGCFMMGTVTAATAALLYLAYVISELRAYSRASAIAAGVSPRPLGSTS